MLVPSAQVVQMIISRFQTRNRQNIVEQTRKVERRYVIVYLSPYKILRAPVDYTIYEPRTDNEKGHEFTHTELPSSM